MKLNNSFYFYIIPNSLILEAFLFNFSFWPLFLGFCAKKSVFYYSNFYEDDDVESIKIKNLIFKGCEWKAK